MHSAFSTSAPFPHRANPDGTIDSICSRCYVTIGTANRESDLEVMEAVHVCEPALLERYREQSGTVRKPPSRQKPSATPVHQRRSGN